MVTEKEDDKKANRIFASLTHCTLNDAVKYEAFNFTIIKNDTMDKRLSQEKQKKEGHTTQNDM